MLLIDFWFNNVEISVKNTENVQFAVVETANYIILFLNQITHLNTVICQLNMEFKTRFSCNCFEFISDTNLLAL